MGLSEALLLDPYPFETWVAVRSAKGTGTLNDPFGVMTAGDFDTLLTNLPAGTVHLGPGTFYTTGYSEEAGAGWQIKPGMRIVGSGTGATTLQLVNASQNAAQYYAIGHSLTKVSGGQTVPNPVDFCEISDLTIDANLQGMGTATVACGGVRLMGNHVRVRRVRVINWGSSSSSKPCFVIALLTGDRTVSQAEMIDVGIENCVADTPASSGVSTTNPITVLHVGGKEAAGANAEAFGKGPFIRNCFVDCGALTNPLTYEIRALSMGWCRGGIIEGNQVHNTRIGGPYQDKATTREIVVRRNLFKNVVRGPFWNLGLVNAPAAANLSSLTRDPDDASNKTALATTATGPNPPDHGLQDGDRVKIDSATAPSQYKGVFVSKKKATNQFTYQMESDPGSGSYSDATYRKVFGVSNLLVERNVIELEPVTTDDPPQHIAIHVADNNIALQTPDYTHTEAIIRGNQIRYLNGQFETTYKGQGIYVEGVKNAIVRDNVVECAPSSPLLRDFRCKTVRYFNNKTPAGALIQGYNGVTQTKYSELETEAEDALLLTLM